MRRRVKASWTLMVALGIVATASLAEGVPEEAVFVPQLPHADTIDALATVPNKPILMTGGRDGTVRFWDERTGRASLYLKIGTGRQIVALAASGIGPKIYVADLKSHPLTTPTRVQLIDLVSKNAVRTYEGHPRSRELKLTLSPDERMLAATGGGQLTLWHTQTGERLASLPAKGRGLTFLDEHRFLFQPDQRITVGDLRDGRMRALFERADGSDLVLSPDRQLIAHCHEGRVTLWKFDTGDPLDPPEPLLGGHRCRYLRFSPDGAQLLIGTTGGRVFRLQEPTWQDQTGMLRLDTLFDLEITTAGNLVTATRRVDVWTLDPLAEKQRLGNQVARITALALSSDRELIASGDSEGRLRLFNLALGEMVLLGREPEPPAELQWSSATSRLHVVQTHGPEKPRPHDPVSALHFTPEKKHLISAHRDRTLTLWDTLAEIQLFSTAFRATALATNDDGLVAAVGPDGLGIWRLSEEETTLEPVATAMAPTLASAVTFGGSGELAVRGNREIWIYNALSGEVQTRFPVEGSGAGPDWIGFDRDANLLDLMSLGLGTRQPASGEILTQRPFDLSVWSVAMFPQRNAWILGGSEGELIHLLDDGTLQEAQAHEANVSALALSPAGDLLLSGSWDATLKLWRLPSFDLLATLQTVGEDGWLVSSPQGYFDGNEAGWREVPFHLRSNPFLLFEPEQFFDLFYEPGMLGPVVRRSQSVAEYLKKLGDPRADLDLARYLDSVAPTVRFVSPEPSMWQETTRGGEGFWELHSEDRRIPSVIAGQVDAATMTRTPIAERRVVVELEVVDRGGGARDCRLFNNRTQIGFVPDRVEGKNLRWTVQLQEEFNHLSAYCFNDDGIRSSQAELLLYGDTSLARKGRAYVLAIGVNDYANTAFANLSYAVADAQALAATLAKGFATVADLELVEPTVLADPDATKVNVLAALAKLAGAPEPATGWPPVLDRLQPLQPEDVLIVFFAGHGVTRKDRYFLIPHHDPNAFSGLELTDDWISDRDLELAFRDMTSPRMALIIDACQSGAALDAEERRRGPMNSRGLAQLAYEKGMLVLAAAQSYAAAIEDRKFGHGILTYALVESGWKDGAAERWTPENELTLLEWFLYVAKEVPILYRDGVKRGGDLLFKPREPEPQRPRVFNRSGDRASRFVVRRQNGGR